MSELLSRGWPTHTMEFAPTVSGAYWDLILGGLLMEVIGPFFDVV